MSLESWLAFTVLWAGLVALPGANAAYVMASALSSGLPRAFYAPLGIALTVPCHSLISALGLSAVLMASDQLFALVKWAGVAYLAWIGVRQWIRAGRAKNLELPKPPRSAARITAEGFLVSIFNPKTAMIYFAIYPQFIALQQPLLPQLSLLMLTQAASALIIYGAYAVLAGRVQRWLAGRGPNQATGLVMGRVSGSIYLAGAGLLALAKRNAAQGG